MSEVVIAAIGRTPIGRAVKGSLIDQRPDDLGAYVVDEVLKQVPQLDRAQIDDVICGCALPGGEQGHNLARIISILAGVGAPGHHGQPLLRVVAAGRPDGLPRHQGGRGLRVRVRRRRVEHPLAARRVRGPAGNARTPGCSPGTGRAARRLHGHGRDGRERGRQVRHHPRGDGPVRPAEPHARGPGRQGRDLRPGDHPGAAGPRHHHDRGRRAQAGHHAGEAGRAAAGVPQERPGHRRELLPAQRRRGRRRGDVAGPRRRARASPRSPASCRPASPPWSPS